MKLKKIYLGSPNVIQDIGSFLCKDLWYDRFYKELKDSDYLDGQKLEDIQNDRLKKIVKHCYKHVPYYKETFDKLDLNPKDITSTDDLNKLPIISREDINLNREKLLAKNIPSRTLIAAYTSGTTGSPMKLSFTKKEMLFDGARIDKHFEMTGVGHKKGHFRIGINLQENKWHYEPQYKVMHLNPGFFSGNHLQEYIGIIRKFKFGCVRGFPSFVYLLANYCKENGIKDVYFAAVVTTSEVLLPHWREVIQEQFQCEVFDQYGSREAVVSAMECHEHNGMHIEPLNGIIELNENNEIIATSLISYAFPLLRYNVGDVAYICKKKCSCGRSSARITRLVGRTNDIIIAKNGRIYDASTLSNAIRHLHGHIKECQFVQDAEEQVTVNAVLANPEKHRKSKQKIRDVLKQDFHLRFNFVDSIPRSKNGKFKFIESFLSKDHLT